MASHQRKLETKIHKRHWYHISVMPPETDIVILTPLLPEADGEPISKRICVAPTVYQCLFALQHRGGEYGYIYRTVNPVKAREAYKVYDAHLTDEHWITSSTRFQFIGEIEDIDAGIGYYHGSEGPEKEKSMLDFCRKKVRTARWKRKN